MNPAQEKTWLMDYYQNRIHYLIPGKKLALRAAMPILEQLAQYNKQAFKLFNEICFSGILPEYDNKWCPEICTLRF